MAGRKESFLLVSLSEDKAKELAQVVSNDTCRKILDYLSEKEATESEIAKELKVPISTVHYNLQHLIKGGLVVVEEFHYSEKGKEVNHYKIANKYIIIAPKTTWGLKERLRKVLPIAVVTVVGAFAIEISRRLFARSGVALSRGFAKSTEMIASAPATEEAVMAAADMAPATVPPEIIIQTVPIWQQAALWFLIGGFVAIITYLLVDWVRNK
ncbi:MAG: helix-turn-helix transcriptional regulator [Nanoarchaeota archaeon]|nr:helix-turn-helix transcriptional regulator [DPANN group archaeon]MBL7116956.1 helix-turn-helix transcriptional regulator [Nanoarchaeota archaeon]